MSSSSPILVVGSINTDLVIRNSRLPAPGETILGGEFYQAAGGKGANQAVAAARASLEPVTFIGAVGDDPFGRESLSRFRSENLDCEYLKCVPGEATGVALILVDTQGQNSISVASGANARLSPSDIEAIPQEVFASAKILLTCLETPLETIACALGRAKEAGLTTILNPAPAPPDGLPTDLLRNVDILTPNESEAAILLGQGGVSSTSAAGDPSQAERAALKLRSLGCRAVIVTLGANGCLVVEQETTRLPGTKVEAIDATAAGDAFNGNLAVALSEGKPLVEAARWAGIAAAISVTRRGAQPSLPGRREVEEFYRREFPNEAAPNEPAQRLPPTTN